MQSPARARAVFLFDVGVDMFQSVHAKFGKMRKAQEFLVRPRSDGTIQVQSDKSIGLFDPGTCLGVLNMHNKTYAPTDGLAADMSFRRGRRIRAVADLGSLPKTLATNPRSR
jgi:hypothetical protein